MKLTGTWPFSRRFERRIRGDAGLDYDCQLAARMRDGDRSAVHAWLERHHARVLAYLYRRLGEGQEELAAKLAANTFHAALGRLRPYARRATATPMEFWMLRQAERVLANHLKGAGRALARATPTSLPDGDDRDLPLLREAMHEMREADRFVLALALFEMQADTEIALTLGTSRARAMRRLRGALKRLGKHLPLEPAI